MKISVITASYQDLAGMEAVAEALRRQTSQSFEWLVADGGSCDGTVEWLEGAGDIVDWWVSSPDRGIFDAWNRAILQATGDWIIFLGGGDYFAADDSLERAIAALQDVPEDMLIAYGRVNLAKSSGEVVQSIGHPWDATQFRTRGMCIPHQATFHRSTLFRQHGLFDVDSFGTGTYEMLLRYLKNNHAYYFDQIVTVMELGGISTQPKNHLHFLKAYWKAQKKHGTFRVNARLVADAAQAIAKEGLFTLLPPHIACGLVQRARALAGHKAHY